MVKNSRNILGCAFNDTCNPLGCAFNDTCNPLDSLLARPTSLSRYNLSYSWPYDNRHMEHEHSDSFILASNVVKLNNGRE